MSTYPKLLIVSDNFNLEDFIQDDGPLSIFEGDLRYIQKTGDTVNGNLIFLGNNIYQNVTTFNNDMHVKDQTIKIYDVGNALVGYFNNTGELLTTKLNDVTDTQISYLDTITSNVQTQINSKADLTAISNMDNTSDINKPISTLQQAGFDTKANASAVSNVDNTSDLGKPVSTAQQTA